ncbi:MAG: rod shape-determining protein RodA [Actinomycetota bacterium]|nr:rod shape-determining protein RodA [Actinomycetota bacterium]
MPQRLGRVLAPKVTERRQTDEVARRLSGLPLRHVDWTLLAVTFFLVGFGMLIQYSATRDDIPGNPTYYVLRTAVNLLIGLVLMGVLMSFDYRRLKVASPFVYGFFLVLLMAVLLTERVMGSSRWISLGFINFQPSEYCKLVLVLVLANFFSDNKADPDSFRSFIIPVAWAVPYMLLIFLQPDLGTTLVLAAILLGMLFLVGCRMRYWLGLVGAGVMGFVFGFVFQVFKPYQVERFVAFLRQGSNIQEAGYHLLQSKIAIGSGQLVGKGLMQGTQTNLNFIPAHHTDFIFAVVGEELGMLGALLLVGVFCLFMWRAVRIASNSRDFYGTMIAFGIVSMFAFQMAVNIGMTMGIMPITGIPLPFISYGGNNLIVSLACVGLLTNIQMRRFSQI